MTKNRGFSFIELLVSIVVFAIVGSMITTILFSALRGASKSNAILNVRQNGANVLSNMTKAIRNAQRLYGISSDDTAYTNYCVPSEGGSGYKYLRLVEEDGTEVTYECSATTSKIRKRDGSFGSFIPLVDSTVMVQPNSCYFTCQRASIADLPAIGIYYTLSEVYPLTPTPGFTPPVERSAQSSFNTSVSLRNR